MATERDYRLTLNFLPVRDSLPAFHVYRKLRQPDEPKPQQSCFGFSLPHGPGSEARANYWVQFTQANGFDLFHVSPSDNLHLTRRAMFRALCEVVTSSLEDGQYEIPGEGFYEELSFNFRAHDEGQEQLQIQPYLLRATNTFGWITDFHFRVRPGVTNWRRVQQLSLSLDRNFKRNLDCYLDRMNRIHHFLSQRRALLDRVLLPGATHPLRLADFASVPARRLRAKTYLFANNSDSHSQFSGLHRYGPLQPLSTPPNLLFAFRERDRQAARILAMALQGSAQKEKFSFPGFEGLFKSKVTIDRNPVVLADLTLASFQDALEIVKQRRQGNQGTIPIFVLPDEDENGYRQHKAVFTHEGIPSQVCTLRIINDSYALKWAIANIALQIFCKAGGQPWKVRPTPDPTLIVGISQSHKIVKSESGNAVEKYFAFSVMTDNSGLFQQLRVLGDSPSEASYLDELRANVRDILQNGSQHFSQVVVHTSFRLRVKEMQAIERVVRETAAEKATQCRFAVVKVNHHSRFFGVNQGVNSLVPFEGTTVKLGGGEHLLWFEGIFPDKQTVTKAFPGPTHVAFLRVSEDDSIADDALLQDLVNLSGANWRGFNAKSAPVSVFYCHLIADLVHEFQEHGLPLPQVQDLRPWFL